MYYFLYSDEQIVEKNKILSATGKKFIPGTVVVNGKRTKFTQLSEVPNISRFIDTKIVASGELNNFVYQLPSTQNKKGK